MNQKLTATAIGSLLALGAGTAHGWTNPEYTKALVPYVVKDVNRTTVVTVIMDDEAPNSAAANLMHLQYWSKSTTDANTASCKPSSVTVPVTANDIVTFDTAGILGYPLFGDSTNPAPLGMGISYAAPQHGYLVVQSPFDYGDNGGLHLQAAYWLELDLANGGAHGDQAFPTTGEFDGLPYFQVMASDGGIASGYSTAVNFWPSSVASTVFTVTPLGNNMLTKENNQVAVQIFNRNDPPVQGAYDRNENGVDGTVPVTVRCVGRVTPAQLMPGVVANAGWAAQGGWGMLANLGYNDTNVCCHLPAAVYQVDTSSAGGKFVDNATRIVTDQGVNG